MERVVMTMVVMFGVTACVNQSSAPSAAQLREYANSFVPADAQDRIVAPDVPWAQISFRVRPLPLQFPFRREELARARANGWTVCEPADPGWTGYDDMRTTPSHYTQTRTAVLYNGSALAILSAWYVTESEAKAIKGDRQYAEPPIQQAVVVVRPSTTAEAVEFARSQEVYCASPTRTPPE
jgi:hypothetical protein